MTPSRNVRVPTDRWRAGIDKAAQERTTLAAKINLWIEADLHGLLEITDGPSPSGNGPQRRSQPAYGA